MTQETFSVDMNMHDSIFLQRKVDLNNYHLHNPIHRKQNISAICTATGIKILYQYLEREFLLL